MMHNSLVCVHLCVCSLLLCCFSIWLLLMIRLDPVTIVVHSWPERWLQVPSVAHELPPVHRGVVGAVVFLLVCGAVLVLSRGALLAWPSGKHSWGEKRWGQGGERGFKQTSRSRTQHILMIVPETSSPHIKSRTKLTFKHPSSLFQLTRFNQTQNEKPSPFTSFLFLFTSRVNRTKWPNYFNCHGGCEAAGIDSANLFLSDNRKVINMLSVLGAVTSPLRVETILCSLKRVQHRKERVKHVTHLAGSPWIVYSSHWLKTGSSDEWVKDKKKPFSFSFR